MNTLVIIPTYNEAENIVQLVNAVMGVDRDIDILVVDDNSPDRTAEKIREAKEVLPRWRSGEADDGRVKLIVREKKDGRGGAVMEGIRYALDNGQKRYEKIVEMDADFSHRTEDLLKLLGKADNCDVVIGSRYLRGSRIENWPWRRKIFSRLANLFARLVLGVPISDYTNGYRVYSRPATEALLAGGIKMKGYITLSEIIYKLHKKKFSMGEVPIVFVNRKRGQSNTTLWEIFNAFIGIIKIKIK